MTNSHFGQNKNSNIVCVMIGIYLILINITTFAAFGVDKYFSNYNLIAKRISEKSLISMMKYGGFVGGKIAMQLFKHKTRKIGF